MDIKYKKIYICAILNIILGNMLFNETTFVTTINVLREQYEFDENYSKLLSKVLSAEDVPAYDNSKLVNHLILLLQEQFPPKNGTCEIERYCWDLNFGYSGGVQVISPSELYHSLMSGRSIENPQAFTPDEIEIIKLDTKKD